MLKLSRVTPFVRSPRRSLALAFMLILTALSWAVFPSSPAGAAEDGSTYRTSCQAVLPGETSGQLRLDGVIHVQYRCFLSDELYTAAQLNAFVSNLRPMLYLRIVGSGRTAVSSASGWTVHESGHGDMFGSDGAGTNGTASSLPDNYIYFDGSYSISTSSTTYESVVVYGVFGTSGSTGFGADGTPAGTSVASPSTETCAEVTISGWNCRSDSSMLPHVAAEWGHADLEARYSSIEDLGRGGLPVPNRCANVKIGVEFQDDDLSVADYDDTLYPANGSPFRDDFVFVAFFAGWNFETEPGGLQLSYRWPGSGGVWSPVFDILDQVTFDSGTNTAMSFRLGTTQERFLSQVTFKCRDTLAVGSETVQSKYLRFWDPGSSVNDPNWQDNAGYLSACFALTVYPVAGTVAPGATARIPYLLEGSAGVTELLVYKFGDASFSRAAGVEAASTTALGVATGGPAPFDWQVAPGQGYLTFELPSTVSEPVAYSDLVWECSDDVNSGVFPPGSADLGITGTLGSPEQIASFAECFKFSGMSLTSPSSWLTGGGKMLACIAQVLFVPEAETLSATVDAFNENVGDKPPWVVFTTIITFAGDVNDAFQSASGSGCFDAGPIADVVTSAEVCAGDGLSVDPGDRSTMALLFTAPMLLGLAGHMLGLIRGEPEFITEPSGQMRWNI